MAYRVLIFFKLCGAPVSAFGAVGSHGCDQRRRLHAAQAVGQGRGTAHGPGRCGRQPAQRSIADPLWPQDTQSLEIRSGVWRALER